MNGGAKKMALSAQDSESDAWRRVRWQTSTFICVQIEFYMELDVRQAWGPASYIQKDTSARVSVYYILYDAMYSHLALVGMIKTVKYSSLSDACHVHILVDGILWTERIWTCFHRRRSLWRIEQKIRKRYYVNQCMCEERGSWSQQREWSRAPRHVFFFFSCVDLQPQTGTPCSCFFICPWFGFCWCISTGQSARPNPLTLALAQEYHSTLKRVLLGVFWRSTSHRVRTSSRLSPPDCTWSTEGRAPREGEGEGRIAAY